MAIQALGAGPTAKAPIKRDGGPEQAPVPSNFKDQAKFSGKPSVKDVAVIGGKAVGGGVLAWIGTGIYDLFFHFGNNGGKSYGTGVYALAAAAGAAIGAILGIRKYQKQHSVK